MLRKAGSPTVECNPVASDRRACPASLPVRGLPHDPDLDLEAILDHLAGVSAFPDDDFAGYGLGGARIADLRRWALGWYDDLAHRLAVERIDDDIPDDL